MTEQYDKENHWYGWNGGECPVHPETRVELRFFGRETNKFETDAPADEFRWDHMGTDGDIIAFRIVKLYREPRKPREWWVSVYPDKKIFRNNQGEANIACDCDPTCEKVLVREVLPEDDA